MKRCTLVAIIAAGVIALMSVLGAAAAATNQPPGAASGVLAAAPSAFSSPPIAVGGTHVCALPGDGTVLCWGDNAFPQNAFGELGNGRITDPRSPAGDVQVQQIVIADAASANGGDCVDVVADGAVIRCHGSASLTDVTAIAAGYSHTCALLADTTVKCWGSNAAITGDVFSASYSGGELGDGTTTVRPAPVTVIAGPGQTTALSGVRSLSAATGYTCALLTDDTAKCWGNAPQETSLAPITVMADDSRPLTRIAAISAGDQMACAVLIDASVVCWGRGLLGDQFSGAQGGSALPVRVTVAGAPTVALSGIKTVSLGHNVFNGPNGIGMGHSCALDTSDGVFCWGLNDVSQLGNGFNGLTGGLDSERDYAVPVIAAPGSGDPLGGVTAIAAGGYFTCALINGGSVKCWGLGFGGDSFEGVGAPVPLTIAPASASSPSGGIVLAGLKRQSVLTAAAAPLANAVAIAAGGGICALLADGGVWCLGAENRMAVVPGVTIAAASPTPIPTPTPSPAPTVTPEPTATPQPAALGPDLVPGDWSVTYGSPSVVTISGSSGSYTVTAKGQVQVTGSSCYLPSGTLIATFSGSGGTYTGQHGLWLTSDCSFANWANMTLTLNSGTLTAAVAGTTERPVFRRIGPVAAQLPFRQSLATPGDITLDPVIVAQSLVIAAGVVIFVPFPGILFNRTLEENYSEIEERVRRARRRLGARRRLASLVGMALISARRRLRGGSAGSEPEPLPDPDSPGTAVAADLALESSPEDRFWTTPVGITLFVLLSALLYGFLDPTFGPDAQSLAAFAGLAAGLVVTLLAFCVPIAIAYRRSSIPFSVRALPGTLVVGVACVLITRLTDFHPGYLYGLVIAFVVARELSVAAEGKAMAQAAGSTFVLAIVAWLGLWWVDTLVPGRGDRGPLVIALQTALVMIVVAGVELTVFGMLPIRYLPGEYVRRWSRRAWAGVFGAGLFGFVHVLINPRNGYLADSTRTPIVTIVILLLFFGLVSVAFWAYFQFRRAPDDQVPGRQDNAR